MLAGETRLQGRDVNNCPRIAVEKHAAHGLTGEPADGMRLSELAQIISKNPEVVDAYEALLSELQLARPHAPGNSVLVTSTEPGEGKTTISLSLAITASLASQTALLIDGDLRRSSLTAAIGSADTVGLLE